MAKTTDEIKKRSGAELRAQREQIEAERLGPAAEAERHEALFLKGIGSAQQEFDWLIAHAAWTHLGFESVVEWWDSRVRPVMVELEMRPTPEMVDKILAAVREAERALPAPQRRTQRELASLVRASDWKVRGRTDPRNRRSAAGSDLDKTAAVVDNSTADEESNAGQSQDGSSAGDGGVNGAAVSGKPQDPPTDQPPSQDAAEGSHVPVRAGTADGQSEQDRPASLPDEVEVPPSTPPKPDEGRDIGDETKPGVSPQDSGEVDREQEPVGVPVSAPTQPAELIEWFADLYEDLDHDVLGPLLTSAELVRIRKALGRLERIAELLETWNERAKQ